MSAFCHKTVEACQHHLDEGLTPSVRNTSVFVVIAAARCNCQPATLVGKNRLRHDGRFGTWSFDLCLEPPANGPQLGYDV